MASNVKKVKCKVATKYHYLHQKILSKNYSGNTHSNLDKILSFVLALSPWSFLRENGKDTTAFGGYS